MAAKIEALPAAKKRRDRAIKRAATGLQLFDGVAELDLDRAVEHICKTRQEFTTVEVWPFVSVPPHEPRAMGAAMKKAQAAGWCEPTEAWKQGVRPDTKSNARPFRVWRSLLCP